jgi:hypothetical protein
LGIGNAWNAWGYSAFHAAEMGFGNADEGEFDFNTALPEVSDLSKFEPPRYGVQRTIVVRVQFGCTTGNFIQLSGGQVK